MLQDGSSIRDSTAVFKHPKFFAIDYMGCLGCLERLDTVNQAAFRRWKRLKRSSNQENWHAVRPRSVAAENATSCCWRPASSTEAPSKPRFTLRKLRLEALCFRSAALHSPCPSGPTSSHPRDVFQM
ncbi:hypothetical protein MTO96_019966 [Rhipicephalus appendiculatus]